MTFVPKHLRDLPRWVTWKFLEGRKPPCDAAGYLVDGNDPANWTGYGPAVDALELSDAVEGVGFVVGDGITMLDLDHCRDPKTGQLDPRAAGLIRASAGAYVEVSPSGEGVKVFGRGANGDGEGRWLELDFRGRPATATWHKSGYGTVTGEALDENLDPDRELPVLDLEALAGAACGSAGGPQSDSKGRGKGKDRPLPKNGLAVPPGGQERAIFRELSAPR